ncbi:hypothetical protein B0H14DRAFT_2618237 [Mycena olivaceomarginata]|nr:hypothetical protein B0H14DRAFT_2618237 [Mycena olivaceomarginata]
MAEFEESVTYQTFREQIGIILFVVGPAQTPSTHAGNLEWRVMCAMTKSLGAAKENKVPGHDRHLRLFCHQTIMIINSSLTFSGIHVSNITAELVRNQQMSGAGLARICHLSDNPDLSRSFLEVLNSRKGSMAMCFDIPMFVSGARQVYSSKTPDRPEDGPIKCRPDPGHSCGSAVINTAGKTAHCISVKDGVNELWKESEVTRKTFTLDVTRFFFVPVFGPSNILRSVITGCHPSNYHVVVLA